MSLIEKFGTWQAVKLIKKFTGLTVKPVFIATCDSSITLNWRGVVLLDGENLWLVNGSGVIGIKYMNLIPWDTNGQFPKSTRGYPGYMFNFNLKNSSNHFSVRLIKTDSGRQLEEILSKLDFS
jgi:hypothetical protein